MKSRHMKSPRGSKWAKKVEYPVHKGRRNTSIDFGNSWYVKAKHVVQGLLQKNPYERLSTAQVCQTDWVSEYLIKSGFLEFLRKQWNEFMREEKVFRRIEVLERAKTLTRSVAEPQVRAPGRPFRRKLTKDEDKLIQRVSAQLRWSAHRLLLLKYLNVAQRWMNAKLMSL